LYDDAGDGYGYENGEYTAVRYEWDDGEGRLRETVSGSKEWLHPVSVRIVGKD
ncbi:MAG: DUF5110 domain-containing protein, partial [Clostridiales bacterium]|nr:DUF5110 domain-containing protein [Clostridiales bacterium]